jgi:ribosome-associated protein
MPEQTIAIQSEFITLDAFLKWAGLVDSGGHAKAVILSGEVRVNGELELRRGRKLRPGDRVLVFGQSQWRITQEEG